MRTIFAVLVLCGAVSAPAQAGGVHIGYSSHYGYGHRHYAPRYGFHGRHHGHYRRSHHHAGHLAAGLILGGLISEIARSQPPTRQVVSRRRVVPPTQAVARGHAAPSQRPPVYLRKTADGRCLLIEVADDGSEVAYEEPSDSC